MPEEGNHPTGAAEHPIDSDNFELTEDDHWSDEDEPDDHDPSLPPAMTVVDGGIPDTPTGSKVCPSTTRKGNPCKNFILDGFAHCSHHLDASEKQERAEQVDLIQPRNILGFTAILGEYGVNLR